MSRLIVKTEAGHAPSSMCARWTTREEVEYWSRRARRSNDRKIIKEQVNDQHPVKSSS